MAEPAKGHRPVPMLEALPRQVAAVYSNPRAIFKQIEDLCTKDVTFAANMHAAGLTDVSEQ